MSGIFASLALGGKRIRPEKPRNQRRDFPAEFSLDDKDDLTYEQTPADKGK
jgi:hypothetical protein